MKNLILVGNPNVGKTTLFNKITNKNEHTGNWSGKTVGVLSQEFNYNGQKINITDLPGVYSLQKNSVEEQVTINYLKANSKDNRVLVFVDGTSLQKGLFLYYQVKQYAPDCILIITMKDILDSKDINIDVKKFEKLIQTKILYLSLPTCDKNFILEKVYEEDAYEKNLFEEFNNLEYEEKIIKTYEKCDIIYKQVISGEYSMPLHLKKLDTLLFNRYTGIPILIFMFTFVLWLSISFSNHFQSVLYSFFNQVILVFNNFFQLLKCPPIINEIVIGGGLSTSFFVASVMIPPMLIFFPLFSFIEEVGLIPRIAFNLDGLFSKVYSNGKNAISMMLGFGCNCVGVTSTRIFEDEKLRRVAILTNNFVPCNGRLPMIFFLVITFLAKSMWSAFLIIISFIGFNIFISLVVSLVFNKLYINQNNNFLYEIPIYKKPNIIKILRISLLEKACYVLGKSITFSFIAGLIVFIIKNININNTNLLILISNFLDPLGSLMGLSGVILLAFIIGISANEIVLPITFIIYSNQSLFLNNGIQNTDQITFITAICMIIFSLNHFPCFASLSTIKKETNSTKFTLLCAIVPTFIGIIFCIITNFILQSLQSFLIF